MTRGYHLMKKALPAVLAILLILGTAVPAAAVPYTSDDGVITMNLPNENWAEIPDPDKWIVFSDGSSIIIVDHFSNGDKLPKIPSADSHYVHTLASTFSTQNEVFCAFGLITDPDATYDIYEALQSIRIQQFDTKTAVSRNSVSASDFSIAAADMWLYVNVGGESLNVRKGYSINSEIIGELQNGASVQVTGIVQLQGADYGWYKIAYGDGSGYVAADYLSETAPVIEETAEEPEYAAEDVDDYVYTGETDDTYLYADDSYTGEW